jgi:hypothetical protein
MIITITTLLAVSIVLMALMCYNKTVELQTGKGIVALCDSNRNDRLALWFKIRFAEFKHINLASIKTFAHSILVGVENFFIKSFLKLSKRFTQVAKVADMIRGKDLPQNKGAVSSFLQNIEISKESK